MQTFQKAGLLLVAGATLASQMALAQELFAQQTMTQQKDVVITRGVAGGVMRTFDFVAGELVGGNPVKAAPYSGEAVTATTQTLADGNRIVNRDTAAVYRDGEGRERREQSLPNIGPLAAQGAPHKSIFISDPVAGVNYALDPASKTAMKMTAPKVTAMKMPLEARPGGPAQTAIVKTFTAPFPAPPPGGPGIMAAGANVMYFRSGPGDGAAPAVEQLGSQVINGVSAEGTRTTITIPAGQIGNDKAIAIVDEVWRSSELQVIVRSEHNDPRMGSTVYSLNNISRNEPAPTLFQVPADYTVTEGPMHFATTSVATQ
jgi:hypothetical protein